MCILAYVGHLHCPCIQVSIHPFTVLLMVLFMKDK